MITSLYASILAIIYIVLTVQVIVLRFRLRISFGDGENKDLAKAIRNHGNFIEYVPLALILLFLLETQTDFLKSVEVLGILLVLARISHAAGISSGKLIFRSFGMISTLAVLATSAGLLLYINIVLLVF